MANMTVKLRKVPQCEYQTTFSLYRCIRDAAHLGGHDVVFDQPTASHDVDLFVTTRRVVAWLDASNLATREEFGLRILKITEEAGEAAQAWIGYTGQNPRKGITHTKEQVCGELADVVLTATVALESLSGDAKAALHDRLHKVEARLAGKEATP